MNRRIAGILGISAGGLLITTVLPTAAAVAEDTADGGAGTAVSDNAFTIDGYTFDPGEDGFDSIDPLFKLPPAEELGGGYVDAPGLGDLDSQQLDVYNGSGDSIGHITANINVANFFGIENTEFTVADGTAADGGATSDLPADGTVYDVANFGNGFYNVYTAAPESDDGSVTDTLVTPLGNLDLSAMIGNFDAAQPLDPAAAFNGLGDDAPSDLFTSLGF